MVLLFRGYSFVWLDNSQYSIHECYRMFPDKCGKGMNMDFLHEQMKRIRSTYA